MISHGLLPRKITLKFIRFVLKLLVYHLTSTRKVGGGDNNHSKVRRSLISSSKLHLFCQVEYWVDYHSCCTCSSGRPPASWRKPRGHPRHTWTRTL